MTVKEIMNLDCRKSGSQQVLQDELKKIRPLHKHLDSDGNVAMWAIEKMLCVAERKNDIRIKYITVCPGATDSATLWRAVVCESDGDKMCDHDAVFAISMYELLAKVLIKEQSIVRMRSAIKQDNARG